MMVMPASHARATLPGWRQAAFAAALLLLPSLAAAQDPPPPRAGAGAAARPNRGAAGTPGLAPLQTEPGDIWAEVRGWGKARTAPAKPEPARRKPAATAESAERPAEATTPKPRRTRPCAPEAPNCGREPARAPANPG
jgi:hypothetical protein